ncbi:hypothetical protein CEXT_650911 [Caerostris extrusa]|uniref:Uncharacterized protein n=1 Tax=Caerostris extrusa TaxID=172846 RepID=A0AAV4Y429_CAEEX|nr:hypothetical protein CEXT_650911 [Caerostris extrusa]
MYFTLNVYINGLKVLKLTVLVPNAELIFTKKDILKLYFNFAPNSNADVPTLKNDIQGLNSQLLKTGMDLRYTERKRRQLQMYNAGIDKSLKHLYQKMRKLKSALHASQQYAESLRNKSELLTRENHHLIHELPRDKSIPAMPGCLVETDEILHRIVLEITSACGTTMGKRMIQYCDIIRRELRLVEISLAKGTDAVY